VVAPAAAPPSGRPVPASAPRLPAPRVLVTRPAAQAAPWVSDLRAAGIDAVALPLIDIGPAPSPAAVDAAWRSLPSVALVFFVSANAVEAFFALRPAGAAWPAATRAGAPGPGTARALAEAGVPAAGIVAPAADAERFDSEQLWLLLRDEPWTGRSVLVVRGEDGRDWLADRWRAAGASVSFVAAYARRPPALGDASHRWLAAAQAAPGDHLWLFSSSEAVHRLAELAPGLPARAAALATHPRIAEAARAAGFARVGACAPRLADVVQAVRATPPAAPASPDA
jgi:uroporphyrinogen-III synthase